MYLKNAKYRLGQVVCHKKHPFRGVIFDVDPESIIPIFLISSVPSKMANIRCIFN